MGLLQMIFRTGTLSCYYKFPINFSHAGDLGNIFVNDGAAIINIFDRIASLDESSPEFIGDRGIVLHALRDDGNPERDPTSTGAAGARLACCSIVKKN